jgi:ABC-type multidrug transport system ATPase subunit
MRADDIAIDIRNLVHVYHPRSAQPVRALDGLTLQVRRGEIFGLLGRNGAGKTTLLRILTTLLLPTGGDVTLLGYNIRDNPTDIRKHLCVVLQENAVELYLSVTDNLETYARFHSIPRREIPRRIARVTEQFGLADYHNQKVIDLSGGLKRRIQVAKVFMVDKPLVFLDEATTGMDPINKRATLDAIRQQARAGRTIVLTTHILEEAEELCDTIAIIDRGHCVATGDLPRIKSLVPGAFDVTISFATLSQSLLEDLQKLPLMRFSHTRATVEATVRSSDLFALEDLVRIARREQVLHLEVHSATLEDVFLELLDPENREDRP